MPHEKIGGTGLSSIDTLTDKQLVTLSPTQFLVATDDEARAISRLIHTIGQEEAWAVIEWWRGRSGQTFVDGSVLVAALEGWLAPAAA
jgi:hypothetical protein